MDPEQVGELIDRHAAALTLYARQWCAAPEDVVQEAFLKLFRQSRPPDHPIAWLYRVVRNHAVSAARSAQRRRRHEAQAASQAAPWFLAGSSLNLGAEEAADAVRRLPLEQREVIVAHVWGGLTFAEIGELTESSASTAYRRYAEGIAALRQLLGVTCPEKTSH
jgi:RNA polymerase sigma-70 factor (ECF subfamily)